MKDDTWINDQVLMLKNAFQNVSVESGDEIGLVRKQICMDRELKQVIITQPKHSSNPCFEETDGG
jgi:hypothetical protein